MTEFALHSSRETKVFYAGITGYINEEKMKLVPYSYYLKKSIPGGLQTDITDIQLVLKLKF